MKKSGLADSPFFSHANTSPVEVLNNAGENSERTVERNPEQTNERTVFRSETRTTERAHDRTETLPFKRRTKRYSFEFYEDQLFQLKRLKYESELSGKNASLSEFVRHALDLYLQDEQH